MQLESPLSKPVYVVGADHTFVTGNFSTKLAEHGLEMIGHYPRDRSPGGLRSIPLSSQAVIIVRNPISHKLAVKATQLADAAGVPVVAVPRRFSKALPILRLAGLVPPPSTGKTLKTAPTETIMFEALRGHLSTLIQSGKHSSRSQMLGVLHREFGPQADLTNALWSRLQKEASRLESDPNGATTATFNKNRIENLADYAALVIEDHPDHPDLAGELRGLVGMPVEDDIINSALKTAMEAHMVRMGSDTKYRVGVQRSWGLRYLKTHYDGGELPSYRAFQKEGQRVLGFKPSTSIVQAVRQEFLDSIPAEEEAVAVAAIPAEAVTSAVAREFSFTPLKSNPTCYNADTLVKRAGLGAEFFNKLSEKEQTAVAGWLRSKSLDVLPTLVAEAIEGTRGNPPLAITVMLCAVSDGGVVPGPNLFCRAYKAAFGKGTPVTVVRALGEILGMAELVRDPVKQEVAVDTEDLDDTLAAVLAAATGIAARDSTVEVETGGDLQVTGDFQVEGSPLYGLIEALSEKQDRQEKLINTLRADVVGLTASSRVLQVRTDKAEAEVARLRDVIGTARLSNLQTRVESLEGAGLESRIDGLVRRINSLSLTNNNEVIADLQTQVVANSQAVKIALEGMVTSEEWEDLTTKVGSLLARQDTSEKIPSTEEYTLRELLATGRSIQIGAAPAKES